MSTANKSELFELRRKAFTEAHPALAEALTSYTGTNSFLQQMRDKIAEWGGLTEGQSIAANRILATERAHAQEAKAADPGKHLGVPGERLYGQMVRVVFCRLVAEARFPKGPVFLVRLETDGGHALTWFTEKRHEPFEDFRPARFTVVAHDTYGGKKQTKVQRVQFT